jgi:hypothetical protein
MGVHKVNFRRSYLLHPAQFLSAPSPAPSAPQLHQLRKPWPQDWTPYGFCFAASKKTKANFGWGLLSETGIADRGVHPLWWKRKRI